MSEDNEYSVFLLEDDMSFKIPKEMIDRAVNKLMAHHITIDFLVFLHRINIKGSVGPTELDVDDFCERVCK